MPIAVDDLAAVPQVRISAASDLLWLLLWIQKRPGHRPHPALSRLEPLPPPLVTRAQRFWGDDPIFSELIVLAHAGGHLFDHSPDALFADLAGGMPALGDLPLRSETREERELILGRLERLRADSRLRRRYVELLRDAWALVDELWHDEALPALEAGVRLLTERATRGADLFDLAPNLPKGGDQLVGLARDALRRGELVLALGYFAGWYLVLDLPGVVLVGTRHDAPSRVDTRRQEMESIAGELRVLADPTRLAILALLAECPLSVTELMGMLGLAQPTISAHIRLLREAGVVRPARSGARTNYTLESERLHEILRRPNQAIPQV